GMAPRRETRPRVVFSPVTPQSAEGRRTEPPVSEPSAPKTSLAATAAPEPLEEPPGIVSGLHGLRQSPQCSLCPVGPYANSAMLSVPSCSAPAPERRCSALDVVVATQPRRIFE